MKRFFAFSLMLLLCAPGAFAQSADDLMVEQAVNQLISRKTITFVANRILTSGGNQSMLTQLNSMTVNKDSLTVSLPYIGKEGSSGNTGGNPLQFTTTDFTYKVEVTKKKDKIITMEVKSPGSDRFTFMLTISKGIMAKLTITSSSRSPMNFSGYIQEPGTMVGE